MPSTSIWATRLSTKTSTERYLGPTIFFFEKSPRLANARMSCVEPWSLCERWTCWISYSSIFYAISTSTLRTWCSSRMRCLSLFDRSCSSELSSMLCILALFFASNRWRKAWRRRQSLFSQIPRKFWSRCRSSWRPGSKAWYFLKVKLTMLMRRWPDLVRFFTYFFYALLLFMSLLNL